MLLTENILNMVKIDFARMERKWQKRWEKAGIFKAGKDPKKKKYYVLEMFPYPSAAGLHMGHIRNYSMGDVTARYRRMNGFNVLYPMGYDAFGLPAENAAIKHKTHPKKYTEKAIEGIKKNQKALGLSYDWDREIATCCPEYYKWNQWFFLRMLKKGLAYRKKAPVNWCPKCNTVLANEQVVNGKCWRHDDTDVEVRNLEQWFLRITAYADRLLKGLGKIDWPENVKKMQENWIGRSEGTEIEFPIKGSGKKLRVFTTRPDTFFGITCLVYAPEHPDLMELVKGTKYERPVKDFINRVVLKEKFERTSEDSEKEGVFTGRYAINPVTKEEIPIYTANFVLMEYGTGAIIAVPAHDQRDFMFAKKYGISIKVVIQNQNGDLDPEKMTRAYEEDGVMVNSGKFSGLGNREAMKKITEFLEKQGIGKATVEYKLRDWLISRQRYWGTPIPVVYCDKCGMQPVDEKELPVMLPTEVKFTGKGNPLISSPAFVNATCPKCGGKAKRETDTMDTFFDSSWYFLRYCSPHAKDFAFSKDDVNYWMNVDQYIGGVEHAVMHLMYARFFMMVLRDEGLVGFEEPFQRLFNQGIVYKDGHKMSKSFGNVVTQEEMSRKYGIDTARLFLLFVASPESQLEWSDKGVQGTYRFLMKIFRLVSENAKKAEYGTAKPGNVNDRILEARTALVIKNVSRQIENFQFNLAIGSLLEFSNHLAAYAKSSPNRGLLGHALKTLVQLLSPFAPHTAEELWEKMGMDGLVSASRWPKAKNIDPKAISMEDIISKLSEDIANVIKLAGIKPTGIRLTTAHKWKYRFARILKKEMKKTRNIGDIMSSVISGELKVYGKEMSRLIPVLVKNPERVPDSVLSQKEEYELLKEISGTIQKEFGCPVSVEMAEKSASKKAGQAMPGKPGIEVI